ncbi:M35 family metallo-endopeptidase [Burkholderia sp. S-53]|uniref:M35 family metallo-endopeptidase n=1 Tax=Burkholderia sp. S-53 TaxID=2906514 RepID=UPI0021D01979|nr:M35 family metallo-endopeptidase [Burkholderia sp. S-53]UXU90276.1 M35 family metallo-endopeptidase [Burkholderia sp. S-53]
MATDDADTQDNGDWIHVGKGESNTVRGSKVVIPLSLNGPPICPNMTDAEFRKLVLGLRDEAVVITKQRIAELGRWTPDIQARVAVWFGSPDNAIRTRLTAGLRALVTVMSDLTAKNFVRPGSDADLATGCLPNMKGLDGEVAHVCRPDTATHTIAINIHFCSLPDRSASNLSSKQLTIVHECSHFIDTFGSDDYPGAYGRWACERLAKEHPEQAIGNADSIAWFVLAR